MSNAGAAEVLSDGFMIRYCASDMFRTYYTCFPIKYEKHVFYECANGKFDTLYSEKFFFESRSWKEVSVPKFVPKTYHEAYLNIKNPQDILKIYNEPPK
jgi:hypothetical protein